MEYLGKGWGVQVKYLSLEGVIEDLIEDAVRENIYKMDRTVRDDNRHHETCVSDGADVWMHDDLGEIGGITGRLYDLLHVGCGHLWQWSADERSGLRFFGDAAWEIGSISHLGASKEELEMVRAYEREAGELAMANLRYILAINAFPEEFVRSFCRFFRDYLNTDLDYIVNYYITGKALPFFDRWKMGSPELRAVELGFPMTIKRRSNKCIALVSRRKTIDL